MTTLITQADSILRGGWRVSEAAQPGRLRQLVALVVLSGVLYGAVMGSFGIGGVRGWQVLYSALKVPLLLLVTFGLALPSFFVINTLMGVRDDWPRVLRALLSTQAVLTIVLASLSPFTMLWYVSSAHYQSAILFNALMFGIAGLSAQAALRNVYRPLLQRDDRHRLLLRGWLILYAFVGIQMAWVLRPFIGEPSTPTQFFRPDGWGNAYLILGEMIGRALGF